MQRVTNSAGKTKESGRPLTPIDEVDFDEDDGEWLLCEKEPNHPYIHPKDLMELIADNMESQWGDENR